MITNFNNIHSKFKLNGIHYSYEDLIEVAHSFVKMGVPFEQVIGEFLLDWLNAKDFINVNTSGSTGEPKTIKIEKQAMMNSAIATGIFFKLKPGDSALHGLPTNFIAGKMMLVRAIILGLELDVVEPTSNLVFNYNKHYKFSAMVPLQLQNSLMHIKHIDTIIVGGTSVSKSLYNAIQDANTSIYETYGMTETVTHIAVKKLNNFYRQNKNACPAELVEASHFKTLSFINLSQDERDCLIIHAPKLSKEKIITNDIVKLYSKTEFEWLGRYDNVINSGGVKLFPERIEEKLQTIIKKRFFIASKKDTILGEQLILVIEDEKHLDAILKEVKHLITLDKYEIPKQIYSVLKFIETRSGKIQRKKTLESVLFN